MCVCSQCFFRSSRMKLAKFIWRKKHWFSVPSSLCQICSCANTGTGKRNCVTIFSRQNSIFHIFIVFTANLSVDAYCIFKSRRDYIFSEHYTFGLSCCFLKSQMCSLLASCAHRCVHRQVHVWYSCTHTHKDCTVLCLLTYYSRRSNVTDQHTTENDLYVVQTYHSQWLLVLQ